MTPVLKASIPFVGSRPSCLLLKRFITTLYLFRRECPFSFLVVVTLRENVGPGFALSLCRVFVDLYLPTTEEVVEFNSAIHVTILYHPLDCRVDTLNQRFLP